MKILDRKTITNHIKSEIARTRFVNLRQPIYIHGFGIKIIAGEDVLKSTRRYVTERHPEYDVPCQGNEELVLDAGTSPYMRVTDDMIAKHACYGRK